MSSNSVCNHSCDKQIRLPLRGHPILLSLVWLRTKLDSYYHCKSKRNQNPNRTKYENTKTPSDTKTKKHLVFFYENQQPDAKQWKIYKLQWTKKLKNCLLAQNRKTDPKNSQNRKTENPNVPFTRTQANCSMQSPDTPTTTDISHFLLQRSVSGWNKLLLKLYLISWYNKTITFLGIFLMIVGKGIIV